jgi:hypothetical protein
LVTVHGKVEEITQSGHYPSGDAPHGVNNATYS